MTRREIRDKVFKIVFAVEFTAPEDMQEQIDLTFDTELPGEEDDDPMLHAEVGEADRAYISAKVLDIVSKKADIDSMISEVSEGWKLSRIGKAELAILRVGVYEAVYEDSVPEKVAINEAVELAKKYCDVQASKFINALLGKVVKKKDAQTGGEEQGDDGCSKAE